MTKKTGREARAERITWFAMISIFLLMSFNTGFVLDGYMTCIILGLILLVSGFYQLSKKWHVSPLTWMIATLLIAAGFADLYFNQNYIDLNLLGLILTAAVIGIGVITNES